MFRANITNNLMNICDVLDLDELHTRDLNTNDPNSGGYRPHQDMLGLLNEDSWEEDMLLNELKENAPL